uniref:Uncharacterized protein n=1 Tax=Candidatus Enterococcus dunnyi TaxID=1834192 RepID=A0A200JBL0_9ENTE|nr:hypothetical protein [Enterococcus sp. 9D6_DIV0238]OUZ34616.1 hypothetical protein A5889_000091 [Enterococcus sp. 9D6_DIV0238]
MSILDKIFIGMLSTAILCVILGIIYFIASILTKKKETELKQKKVKNKKKRRLIKKRIQVFIKKRKKQMRLGICFCIVGLFFTSGALYI